MDEVNQNMDSNYKNTGNEKIELLVFINTLWNERKSIIIITSIALTLGLVFAFGSTVEYEASCKLLPDSNENTSINLGGLGGLAGLAGIDLGGFSSNSGVIPPELYPEISRSLPYVKEVMNKPLMFTKHKKSYSAFEYFSTIHKPSFSTLMVEYTIGLPFKLKSVLSKKELTNSSYNNKETYVIQMSFDEFEIIRKFKERIFVSVDKKTGIILIECKMPDAIASAELTQNCVEILTNYITEYKINKAKDNLNFITERYNEAKIKFELAQEKLASFSDENRNVVTAIGQMRLNKLENDYNLAFEVFKELSKQMEQIKIKVKDETPVFTILEPVQVPVKKSSPKRMIILIASLIFGTVFGIVFIYTKMFYSQILKRYAFQ